MHTSETVPVAEGLFQGAGVNARLIGTACASCGAHYFPKSLSCRNPECSAKQVGDVLLGPRGTLYSYTRQYYRPPPLFCMEPWAPYVIALVELPEGLRVMGMLCECSDEQLKIGMDLELTVEALYRGEDGREVLTYKFRPTRAPGEVQ